MTKGAIVLAPFPFTNLTSVKRRPAIVVSNSSRLGNDVILAFISSKISQPITPTDFVLETSHPDFKKTGLKKTSVFKMDKLVTLENSILIGELGKVSDRVLSELNQKLRIALDL